MQKIILTFIVSFVSIFIYSKPCFASVDLVYPIQNTVVETKNVTFQWHNTDDSSAYCYNVVIGTKQDSDGMWYPDRSAGPITSSTYTFTLSESYIGKVHWYVSYGKQIENDCKLSMYSTTSESFIFNPTAKQPLPTPITQTVVKTTIKKDPPIVSPVIPDSIAWNVNTMDTPSVLGVSSLSHDCEFKYVQGEKKASLVHCNSLLFNVSKVERSKSNTFSNLYVYGSNTKQLNILVNVYTCERKLLDPKTWFSCKEKLIESKVISSPLNIFFNVKGKNHTYDIEYFEDNVNSYKLMCSVQIDDSDLYLEYKYKMSVTQYGIFLDGGGSIQLINTDTSKNSYKTFEFPLTEITGVTQWHGDTEYQKPHTGIDFGATKQDVVAVAKGEVVAMGWDNYKGDCFAGGNYLLIRQSNGMYSVYFHLGKIYVNVGQKVKAKQIIAVSGNTGSWNCQPLAYHLHFETRLKQSQSSHVDPVKYINIDWNQVLTLGANISPGRLSGDNPHPGI